MFQALGLTVVSDKPLNHAAKQIYYYVEQKNFKDIKVLAQGSEVVRSRSRT